MLRFQSLELVGFKSFSDKVRLSFDDGITAIVGPNGCGKSNLADSIGWVLGMQNTRSLRGARMEDLIFNGTQKRKPSGLAEVTLKLQQMDQTPILLGGIELSGETLEITRKLYRSGESLYLINQSRCRLKDIHQLLENAGLGFASYALIEQGKIDSVLVAKPLERRAIIEEAAQILGYKSRRRSAELKLEMASQNLLRINDVISEVERQLRSLKRQAGKARRYRELKEEFRQIQRQKFALEAEQDRSQLKTLDGNLANVHSAEQSLKQELELRQKADQESVRKKDEQEELLAERRQRRSQIHLQVDRSENSLQYQQEQIEATSKSLDSNIADQETLAESLQGVLDELGRLQAERTTLQGKEASVQAALREQEERVEGYAADLLHAEAELEEMRSSLLRLAAETASLSNLEDEIQQHLEGGQASRKRLEGERSGHSAQLTQSQSRVKESSRAVEQKRAEMTRLREQLQEQKEKEERLEKQAEATRALASEIENQLIAFRERLQSLQEIELRHSQYSQGVQQFLNHLNGAGNVQPRGTLADFVETNPKYERMVEGFLDQELEYVLVDSLDEAVRGVLELKTLKAGKCTFLSLNSSNGFGENRELASPELRAQKGVFGTVSEVVQMKPEVEGAFHRALPQRASAVVVSDLDRAVNLARSYPESTFVTLEGDVLASRGLLSASARHSQKLGLLALKRQKKELEKKVLQQQKKRADLLKLQEQQQKEFLEASDQRAHSQEVLYHLEKEILELIHQQEQWEREQQLQNQSLSVVAEEIQRLDQEQKQQQERLRQLKGNLVKKRTSREELEQILSKQQKSLQQMKLRASQAQEELHLIRSDRTVLQERLSALHRTSERVEEQQRDLEGRQARSQTAAKECRERLDQLVAAVETLRSDLEHHREEALQTEAVLTQLEEEYSGWKETQREIESELVHLRDRKSQLQEERTRFEVERARLETRFQNLSQQCSEQLQMALEQLADGVELENVTLEEVLEPYTTLKSRLEAFGPINMTALEEYQENEERHTFLTRQRQDIEQSIADTRRVIQEINRRSREKFGEAFEAINRYLKEVFQTLFGGGDCGLRLLDEEDPLETGIDIYAQPPGKKLQNATLLSGGEKALTALALLVALFRYRPSQFCLLDEVDAVLDDANVVRFTTLVEQMSQDTQFIVITHNKRTMQIAQSILGVTMEKPGISQLVSARF